MRKTTQKQQRSSSTDSLIKTGKRRDIELAEDELNQVTGGDKTAPVQDCLIVSKTNPTKEIDVTTLPTKSKY